jgi:hypothetical protein
LTVAISAVWRRHDWQAVDIVGEQADGQLVLRETGRFYRGVFLAPREQVRIAGREFYLRGAA